MRNPALDQREYERIIDQIQVCGKNRGPHDYIPVVWSKNEENEVATQFMCRVCLKRVNISTIAENFELLQFDFK